MQATAKFRTEEKGMGCSKSPPDDEGGEKIPQCPGGLLECSCF